jgi:hypothetical protein
MRADCCHKAAMQPLHIGLDLDNTIVSYDAGFPALAVELGLLPASHGLTTKDAVKTLLWRQPDGETLWMRLQGQMYGRYIEHGRLHAGVGEFLRAMHVAGNRLSIVSHKTRYGHFDANRVDLWDAAVGWLERRGLFAEEFGLRRDNVHFRETRAEKLATIGQVGCDVFIDDLPEVLLDPAFPRATTGLWFAAGQDGAAWPALTPYRDWPALRDAVHGLAAAQGGGPRLPHAPGRGAGRSPARMR